MLETHFTLRELNLTVQQSLATTFPSAVWVIAEISQLNVNSRNGHCYLELIEKDPKTNSIVAKSRATIWGFAFSVISSYFKSETGHPLSSGLKVLVKATVEFHEVYSMSLNISDIDPNYTLGDIARRRQEIINQLLEEGVFDLNMQLNLSSTPHRIAVVSSPTAAGYDDFCSQLLHNKYGFAFSIQLFEAVMQGEKTEASVVNALDRIAAQEDNFDVVVLIRGGGSKSDLAWFDSYEIAANIAQFPIPVLTGIGHERDESIADLVAYKKLKTPTAVAEFLIAKLFEFDSYLTDLQQHLSETVKGILTLEKRKIESISIKLNQLVTKRLHKEKMQLHSYMMRMQMVPQKKIQKERQLLQKISFLLKSKVEKQFLMQNNRLQLFENTVKLQNPQNILNKGYSFTLSNGKILRHATDVKKGDVLETQLMNGSIKSIVE